MFLVQVCQMLVVVIIKKPLRLNKACTSASSMHVMHLTMPVMVTQIFELQLVHDFTCSTGQFSFIASDWF